MHSAKEWLDKLDRNNIAVTEINSIKLIEDVQRDALDAAAKECMRTVCNQYLANGICNRTPRDISKAILALKPGKK